MTEIYQPLLDARALQKRFADTLQRRAEETRLALSERPQMPDNVPEIILQASLPVKPEGTSYQAADLLQFHDQEFLRTAYEVLLGRDPDAEGSAGYLAALRSGQVNRLDVLARLRFSAEGVRRAVPVTGLRGPALLRRAYRVPVVGPLLRWLVALARLPNLVRHVTQMEAHLIAQQERLAASANRLNHSHTKQLRGLTTWATQIQQEIKTFQHQTDAAQVSEVNTALQRMSDHFGQSLARLSAAQHKTAQAGRRLAQQQEELATIQTLWQEQTVAARQASAARLDGEQAARQALAAELAQLRVVMGEIQTRQSAAAHDQQQLVADLAYQAATQAASQQQMQEMAREFTARWQETAQNWELRGRELAQQIEATANTNRQQIKEAAQGQETQSQELARQITAITDQQIQSAAETRVQASALDLLAAKVQESFTRIQHTEQELRAELALQSERLESLLASQPLLPGISRPVEENPEHHQLDAFYMGLEDRLRGSRETLRQRLQVYLPFLRQDDLGTVQRPVLDVGCGRGEWLELLREENYQASGVDLNRIAIQHCRKLDLAVTEADALSYLRTLPAESYGVITCFHLVEHLPLAILLQMLNEMLRVLQKGGLLICETPNPRNVLVGTCNFYYDPTHRNPVPAPVLQFMLESRGFERIQVLELNPSDAQHVAGEEDVVQRFNHYFYGPMDYAALGRKP